MKVSRNSLHNRKFDSSPSSSTPHPLTTTSYLDIILIRCLSTKRFAYLEESEDYTETMELRGKHLVLKNTGIDASEVLLPAFNGDEQFNLWSGYGPALTLAEVRADILETQALPSGTVWQINDHTDRLVGVAETAILHPPHGAWIALLIIRREFQGRGYGSEAAMLLKDHFFSFPQITQIGLAVLVKNAPGLSFWEKRGYVRGSRVLDNYGNDVYQYFLMRSTS